jgi:hypothetical protein
MFNEPVRFELLERIPKRNIPKEMNIQDLKYYLKNNIIYKMQNLKIKSK